MTARRAGRRFEQAWEYLCHFEPKPGSYVRHNLKRFLLTIDWLPKRQARVLDLGSDRHFALLLAKERPGYDISCVNLRVARGAPADAGHIHEVSGTESRRLGCATVDVEHDALPWDAESVDIVLCLELIEHLLADPVHMVLEIHRVLKPGGALLLTTPNMLSWRHILNAVGGIYPMEHMKYHRSLGCTQHVREYSPWEIRQLLEEAGFRLERLRTFEVTRTRRLNLLERTLAAALTAAVPLMGRHPKFMLHRHPKIFALCRKNGVPKENAGRFLYIESQNGAPLDV